MNDPGKQPTEAVGARIREARLARGMTQAELASAVGVTRSAVAQWETERAGQVRANLTRIAAVLGVSVQFLLEGGGGAAPERPENATELALLRLYRSCTEEDRAFLLRTATRLARVAEREGGRG
ncbi:MAG: helix-turn-helix transcriptional regulator [Rhodospirillales bacterium]|nr:helix-turn-helix transcriptional regulator [Rhodospirillales bacterium]